MLCNRCLMSQTTGNPCCGPNRTSTVKIIGMFQRKKKFGDSTKTSMTSCDKLPASLILSWNCGKSFLRLCCEVFRYCFKFLSLQSDCRAKTSLRYFWFWVSLWRNKWYLFFILWPSFVIFFFLPYNYLIFVYSAFMITLTLLRLDRSFSHLASTHSLVN